MGCCARIEEGPNEMEPEFISRMKSKGSLVASILQVTLPFF